MSALTRALDLIGHMTQEETAELVKEAMGFLTEDQLYALLRDSLTKVQKEECAAQWGFDV